MNYIYVDHSNVFIEALRASAVQRGLARDIIEAEENRTLDWGYRLSFCRLHQFLTANKLSYVKRIALFGSRSLSNGLIWQHAKRAGFDLHLEDRDHANKEKKIDTGIATLMAKDAYKHGDPQLDCFILVAGDKDYVPTLKALREDNYNVKVVFWSHAARELKSAASAFVSLDEHLDLLRL